mmetsp:Transcript_33147/g.53241  ORF Transcript_33147/g.53241 Transcript_33147/m.53241 type:complete len:553 (-) Transcript_33147:135-1793(-)
MHGGKSRPRFVHRSIRSRAAQKSKSRAIGMLCTIYFTLLLVIYMVFILALVVPMTISGPSAGYTHSDPVETQITTDGPANPLPTSKQAIIQKIDKDLGCSSIDSRIHIIFSTGCNLFQHWQAEVLLHSAMKAGQCGRITRIVSGCEQREDEGKKTDKRWITHQGGKTDQLVSDSDLRKSVNPKLEVHVTPMFPQAKEFPWWNKPLSISHFSTHGNLKDDEIIIILDPDEFFIHALTQNGSPYSHVIASGGVESQFKGKMSIDQAQPGKPVAQYYGLGAAWLNMFDLKKTCGEASPCLSISHNEASEKYSVGPPYILHVEDYKKVAVSWETIMKPVYEQDRGDMQADMYAYIMSAAHHKLPHTRLNHFMVSDVGIDVGEAWSWIDYIQKMSCVNPRESFPSRMYPPFSRLDTSPKLPPLVHAAQHFKAHHPKTKELWNFHKGHIPGQILDCDQPLVVPPPDDLFTLQTQKREKRSAFMVCWMTYLINESVIDYKKRFCRKPLPPWAKRKAASSVDDSPTYNSDKCIRIVETKANVPECDKDKPDCYPLAKRVC